MSSTPRRSEIIDGDCVPVLAAMPENSVDSCVTDPPYGLEFMGKEWDRLGSGAWHLRWATEVLRVLKPGGHLLAFGGTRTYHRLACAIEDAGFEVRDCIEWFYGNGFPKSHNVAMGLDKATGASNRASRFNVAGGDLPNHIPSGPWQAQSGEAIKWNGWGTALKPAHEPIVVARKPLTGTVAENVLAFGTGAINVDACRAGPPPNLPWGGVHPDRSPFSNGSDRLVPPPDANPLGRWPPNLLLTHSPECCRVGPTAVPANGHWPSGGKETRTSDPVYKGGWSGDAGREDRYAETDLVDAHICASDCPVAGLDRQSGDDGANPTGPRAIRRTKGSGAIYGGGDGLFPEPGAAGTDPGDVGTASRFFPQFGWEAEAEESSFLYTPKAARSEREAGLTHVAFVPLARSNRSQTDQAAGATDVNPTGGLGYNDVTPVKNHHPTVKPIALLRWLERLVTPPGGLVLDPFAGSGTGGAAAALEGFGYIGIERESAYCEIARRRIAYWAGPRAATEDVPGGRPRGRERSLDSFGEAP